MKKRGWCCRGFRRCLAFLIAVFNRPFFDLDPFDRVLHLSALVLVAVSIGLIMAPAAYHRLAERGRVSSRWIKLASLYIASAMATLMIAVSVDIYVVATMIVSSSVIGVALGALTGCFLGWLWFAVPLMRKSRQRGAQ
jgi:xanthine/uracil permease